MAEELSTMPVVDDKQSISDVSDEKKAIDGVEISEDAVMAKEVEEFEERLQNDEATEGEYLVQEAYEVAIKVRFPPCPSCARTAMTEARNRFCPPAITQTSPRSRSGRSSSVLDSRRSAREFLPRTPPFDVHTDR